MTLGVTQSVTNSTDRLRECVTKGPKPPKICPTSFMDGLQVRPIQRHVEGVAGEDERGQIAGDRCHAGRYRYISQLLNMKCFLRECVIERVRKGANEIKYWVLSLVVTYMCI